MPKIPRLSVRKGRNSPPKPGVDRAARTAYGLRSPARLLRADGVRPVRGTEPRRDARGKRGNAGRTRSQTAKPRRPVAARARPRPTCESFRERFRNGPVVHVPQTCCTTPHSAVLESQSGPQLHTRLTGTGHSAIRWSLRAGRLRILPALCAVWGGDQCGRMGEIPLRRGAGTRHSCESDRTRNLHVIRS